MPRIVLVIDNNSAVQAIAALALNETDCHVESVSDGASAMSKIRELQPDVVLCSRDIPHVDPFKLCTDAKRFKSALAFVLLSPTENMQETQERARSAHCDEVLFKPFKSNRLRETVVRLFEHPPAIEQATPQKGGGKENIANTELPGVALHIGDPLRRSALQRIVRTLGFSVADDVHPAAGVIFFDRLSAADATNKALRFVLGQPDSSNTGADADAWIPLPLTEQNILAALRSHFPSLKIPGKPRPALSSEQVARLAAQISSSLFMQLLDSPAVRRRDWDQVALLFRRLLDETAAPLGSA